MPIFLAIQEAKIKVNNKFEIPDELITAWLISNGISWRELQIMPEHEVEKFKAFLHLQNVYNSLNK